MRRYQWVSHDGLDVFLGSNINVSLGPKYQCFSWLQISMFLSLKCTASSSNQPAACLPSCHIKGQSRDRCGRCHIIRRHMEFDHWFHPPGHLVKFLRQHFVIFDLISWNRRPDLKMPLANSGKQQGHSCTIGNACFTGTLKRLNPNLLRKVQF